MASKIKQSWLVMSFFITGIFIANLTNFIIKSAAPSRPNKIVTVDLSAIINQEVSRIRQGGYTDEQIAMKSKHFVAALSSQLDSYAKEKRVIIVPREAIIAGVKDVTLDVMRQGATNAA